MKKATNNKIMITDLYCRNTWQLSRRSINKHFAKLHIVRAFSFGKLLCGATAQKKQTAHNCKRNKVIKLIVSLFQLQRAVRGSSSTVAWGTLTHTKRRYITLCVHSYLAADHREINSKSLRETRTEEINKLFIEKAN